MEEHTTNIEKCCRSMYKTSRYRYFWVFTCNLYLESQQLVVSPNKIKLVRASTSACIKKQSTAISQHQSDCV